MSLDKIKRNGLRIRWVQVQSLQLITYSCPLKSTPLLLQGVPRIWWALYTHAHLYSPTFFMLRPTMGAPLCPNKSGLGANLSFSWTQGEKFPNGSKWRHKRIRKKGNPIATCRAEKVEGGGRGKKKANRNGEPSQATNYPQATTNKYSVHGFTNSVDSLIYSIFLSHLYILSVIWKQSNIQI